MLALGPLSFAAPWILLGLAALPAIWWLLRISPPMPKRVRFPAIRFLAGLAREEETPAHTPLWLLLIRMAIAALIVLALAEPVWNPARPAAGAGPLVIVTDNGWAAAARWNERRFAMDGLIADARRADRAVLVAGTAPEINPPPLNFESAGDADARARAIEPRPIEPDRIALAERLEGAAVLARGAEIVWISDGLDYGAAAQFASRLSALAGDGGLTLINSVEAGADPAYVATDRTRRFLLTAYYVAAKVAVHRIGDDGSLSEQPVQEIATNTKAHAIMTDASNRLAFVPHTGPNAIYQFRFDEQTGRLSPNDPLIVDTGQNTGPRQLAFHPKLDVVFFDYEQGSAIAAFNLDRNSGQLSFRERLSSIPDDFTKTNSNARIEIHPSGEFIYVANRGHDSIAGYRVDSLTGKLTGLGQTPTEPTPRGFTIAPTGRFLYAAGQSSDRLAAFRIDRKTGALHRVATYEVGQQPWWVHVVRIR